MRSPTRIGAVALVSVFLGGQVAKDLFGTIGLGDTAAGIWRFARWVVAIVAVLGIANRERVREFYAEGIRRG
jgi:hypothetical protein